MKNRITEILCLATSLVLSDSVQAMEHHKVLTRYLTEDVVAVAYLDVTKINLPGSLQWAKNVGLGHESEERDQATRQMLAYQEKLDRLVHEGIRYVYALFRISDLPHGGPLWVVPMPQGGDTQAVLKSIRQLQSDLSEGRADRLTNFLPSQFKPVEGSLLGAYSSQQLEAFQAGRNTRQPNWANAWKSLGNGDCGLLLFGDKDSRKVLREMFPTLPEPFEAINGAFLADKILWTGFVAEFSPKSQLQLPQLRLIVETQQEASATELQQAGLAGLALLKKLPALEKTIHAEALDSLTKAFVASVHGRQLVVTFNETTRDLQHLARLVNPPVQKARQASQRAVRVNQFKQITQAMMNYESSQGTFPPRGSYTEDGKPLLSWRVHLLPYLNQDELYQKFRLDEPWDSEHNQKLIPLIPEVYTDPDPKLHHRNALGRTTFVVPTGEKTVFSGIEGTPIKTIIDGTSNTILLVEIPSMRAPIWTKPTDWLVHFSNPWEGVRRDDREWFTAGFCDGHVQVLNQSLTPESLRALLTYSGRDAIYP